MSGQTLFQQPYNNFQQQPMQQQFYQPIYPQQNPQPITTSDKVNSVVNGYIDTGLGNYKLFKLCGSTLDAAGRVMGDATPSTVTGLKDLFGAAANVTILPKVITQANSFSRSVSNWRAEQNSMNPDPKKMNSATLGLGYDTVELAGDVSRAAMLVVPKNTPLATVGHVADITTDCIDFGKAVKGLQTAEEKANRISANGSSVPKETIQKQLHRSNMFKIAKLVASVVCTVFALVALFASSFVIPAAFTFTLSFISLIMSIWSGVYKNSMDHLVEKRIQADRIMATV